MELARLKLIFLFSFIILIPCLSAIAEADEVWRRRAEEAMQTTEQYYDPDPVAVASNLNMKVQEYVNKNTNTKNPYLLSKQTAAKRGLLNAESGQCEATNPIDKCWRCKENWAEDRQALAGCALGFGSKATGGKGGKIYEVTDSSDNNMENPKAGTLRHAVIQKEPLWIIFAKDMNIKLQQELVVQGNKTIDGRGANVHIANGAGIRLQFVQNVIIHGIHIHNISPASGGMIRDSVDHVGNRGPSDGDAVSVFGSSNIWLDHLTLSEAQDGLIDAIQGSTAITISNCHLSNHDKAILLGASDTFTEDKKMQVTVAFNRFDKGLVQRMPCIRFGFAHVVNNDYNQWEMYAIGGLKGPTILSQGNRFFASDNKNAKEVTKRMDCSPEEGNGWIWRSEGDVFLNGAYFNASGDPKKQIKYELNDVIKPTPGTEVERITKFAGALVCKPGQPC
ncbi:putative pectate lyase 19 [Citrus sinensis]|uniref:Pectate lyase 19 n=1 Tax=Citrus sinensis TaxID=2711 RepID=A0ACB8L5R5_CITSI|nr:putative pectate lyase 19 [Citrus sinensis]